MRDKQLTFLIALIGALALFAIALFLAEKNFNLNFISYFSLKKPTEVVLEQEPYPLKLTLTSSVFENEGVIPDLYTCKGKDINPPLAINNTPKNTKSFVLIFDDVDAPYKTWTHWIVYNIDARQKEIAQNTPPWNSVLGQNDFGVDEYRGPCPPLGKHRYYFRLYALDTKLDLEKGSTREKIEEAMEKHILDKAELMSVFER